MGIAIICGHAESQRVFMSVDERSPTQTINNICKVRSPSLINKIVQRLLTEITRI
ncbi:hypothetical protein [Nodularia chucula]|uniref:hypothetical protein n=1 Tax=Nodularia chucula TaxID=3093667 RepID=UPI0039C60595